MEISFKILANNRIKSSGSLNNPKISPCQSDKFCPSFNGEINIGQAKQIIDNFGQVTKLDGSLIDNLYRGGRLNEKQIKFLYEHGVRTFVDFRSNTDKLIFRTMKLVNKFKQTYPDIEFIHIPIVNIPLKPLSKAKIEEFLGLISERLEKEEKVYCSCHHGSDRTGIMMALYKSHLGVIEGKVITKDVLQTLAIEMKNYKFHFGNPVRFLNMWIKTLPRP